MISWPLPWQVAHRRVAMMVPNTLRRTSETSPVPPHRLQRTGVVPGSAPLPPHASHTDKRSTGTSLVAPKAASSKVRSRPRWTLLPRAVRLACRAGRRPKGAPKKASKMSVMSPMKSNMSGVNPSPPYMSYC